MDRLWAPWRMKFIEAKKDKKCIFCLAARQQKKYRVVLKTKYSLALLNAFPYNNGHMMICPLRHVSSLGKLGQAEMLDLINTLTYTQKMLDKILRPDGYNIGINTSEASGAGIAAHLHIHIVPRFIGDVNFMPVLYDTKVLPESLDAFYKKFLNAKSKRN